MPAVSAMPFSASQRVCLLGAECTGKTWLAQRLAAHFNGLYVAEYLRDWCDRHGYTPQAHQQLAILQAQIYEENKALALMQQAQAAIIFCDSAPLMTAVYSAHYFTDPTLYPAAHIHHRGYALTLLLQPDLPWQADGVQRDGVATQQAVHALLEHELAGYPLVVRIGGAGDARLQSAISAVKSHLATKLH